MILATWYKLALKDAFLNQVYSNKGKTGGILSNDPGVKEKIYEQYLKAYKKGVFNYIKEDMDTIARQPVPRKYFSGGLSVRVGVVLSRAQIATKGDYLGADGAMVDVETNMSKAQTVDAAMSESELGKIGFQTVDAKNVRTIMSQVAALPASDRVVVIANTPFAASNETVINFLNSGRQNILALKGLKGVFDEFYFDGHPKAVGASREIYESAGIKVPKNGILDPFYWPDGPIKREDLTKELGEDVGGRFFDWLKGSGFIVEKDGTVDRQKLVTHINATDFKVFLKTSFSANSKQILKYWRRVLARTALKNKILTLKDKVGLPLAAVECLEIKKFRTLKLKNAQKIKISDGPFVFNQGDTVYANLHILDLRVRDEKGQERNIRTYQNSPVITDKVIILGVGPETIKVWGKIIKDAKAVVLVGDANGFVEALDNAPEGQIRLHVSGDDKETIKQLEAPDIWKPLDPQQHLSAEELALLERVNEEDGQVSNERITRQVVRIETALGATKSEAEAKARLIIADLEEKRVQSHGEEVAVLNGVTSEGKVIGRIDRNIAEKYGYIHETANVVLETPDGKIILQLRNKKVSDDHLAMYGEHLEVGQSHFSGALKVLKEEAGLSILDTLPAFVGYQGYDMPGDSNRERRSWFVKRLTPQEYEIFKANQAAQEAKLGVSKKNVTRSEYKQALFRNQEENHDGTGEVFGVYVTFEQLSQAATDLDPNSPFEDKTNRYLSITEEFKGGPVTTRAFFSPGSLNQLLSPANADLWRSIQETLNKETIRQSESPEIVRSPMVEFDLEAVAKAVSAREKTSYGLTLITGSPLENSFLTFVGTMQDKIKSIFKKFNLQDSLVLYPRDDVHISIIGLEGTNEPGKKPIAADFQKSRNLIEVQGVEATPNMNLDYVLDWAAFMSPFEIEIGKGVLSEKHKNHVLQITKNGLIYMKGRAKHRRLLEDVRSEFNIKAHIRHKYRPAADDDDEFYFVIGYIKPAQGEDITNQDFREDLSRYVEDVNDNLPVYSERVDKVKVVYYDRTTLLKKSQLKVLPLTLGSLSAVKHILPDILDLAMRVNHQLNVDDFRLKRTGIDSIGVKPVGGIDLNAKNMSMVVTKNGKGAEMTFDPAMITEFQRGDYTGITAKIIRITPITSALSTLGMQTSQVE